jgi:hypothetical protein
MELQFGIKWLAENHNIIKEFVDRRFNTLHANLIYKSHVVIVLVILESMNKYSSTKLQSVIQYNKAEN